MRNKLNLAGYSFAAGVYWSMLVKSIFNNSHTFAIIGATMLVIMVIAIVLEIKNDVRS